MQRFAILAIFGIFICGVAGPARAVAPAESPSPAPATQASPTPSPTPNPMLAVLVDLDRSKYMAKSYAGVALGMNKTNQDNYRNAYIAASASVNGWLEALDTYGSIKGFDEQAFVATSKSAADDAKQLVLVTQQMMAAKPVSAQKIAALKFDPQEAGAIAKLEKVETKYVVALRKERQALNKYSKVVAYVGTKGGSTPSPDERQAQSTYTAAKKQVQVANSGIFTFVLGLFGPLGKVASAIADMSSNAKLVKDNLDAIRAKPKGEPTEKPTTAPTLPPDFFSKHQWALWCEVATEQGHPCSKAAPTPKPTATPPQATLTPKPAASPPH